MHATMRGLCNSLGGGAFVSSGRRDLNLRARPQPAEITFPQSCISLLAGPSCSRFSWVFLSLDPVLDPVDCGGQGFVDHRELTLGRRVVHVDPGRLDVGVAKELLDRAGGLAGRG
jgi:hypothetical protein